jgi:hypothetical protein
MRRVRALLLLFFSSYPAVLRAQSTNGSIAGLVTDPTKAVIMDAKVAAIIDIAAHSVVLGRNTHGCHNANLEMGSTINVDFTPDSALPSVHAAAQALPADPSRPRFNHFNWLQYIEHWPQCVLNSPNHTAALDPVFLTPAEGSAVTAIGFTAKSTAPHPRH